MDVVVVLTWILTSGLMLIGLAGVVIPILPGTTLILLAAIFHRLLIPEALAWSAIAWIAGIWILSVLADFAGVILGTKLGGGSKWGMAGAGAGSFIGIWFSLPALILGTVLGAVVAEKFFARQTDSAALKAGAGAAVGFILSTVARLACALAMIAAFGLAIYLH